MKNLTQARQEALDAHGSQMYGELPYSYHLDKVYELICEAGLDDNFKYGAYLHDTMEDTHITKSYIEKNYNSTIAQMVDCVSGFGLTRKEKHLDMINKLSQYPQYINLKMADRIANMRHCVSNNNQKQLKMYMKEMDSFKPLFMQGSVYYKNIFEKEFNFSFDKKLKP